MYAVYNDGYSDRHKDHDFGVKLAQIKLGKTKHMYKNCHRVVSQ